MTECIFGGRTTFVLGDEHDEITLEYSDFVDLVIICAGGPDYVDLRHVVIAGDAYLYGGDDTHTDTLRRVDAVFRGTITEEGFEDRLWY